MFINVQKKRIWNNNGSWKWNVEISGQYNISHAYCFDWNPGWKKMRFQLALNKTSCPTPPPLICRRLKHRQRIKNYKTMLSASPPHRFSKQISQYQYWKTSKYSILMVIEFGSPESSNGSQNFIPNSPPLPLILNTNFIKRESKIDYP